MNNNELVSIVMLSRNRSQYLEATIISVLGQTYQNWELIFIDDASSDNTIKRIMELRDGIHPFRISQCVFSRGETVNRNSALRDARGKWIAFLDAGDIWEPQKLENQVNFMKENDYAFSYTFFDSVDSQYAKTGYWVGGPGNITEKMMLKCCWVGYLTVMFDREKVGLVQVDGLKDATDYALWLMVVKKADCYLLPECLGSLMSEKGIPHRLFTSYKWVCRYEAYRKIEGMNPLASFYMTVRNLLYTIWKWFKYAHKEK